MEEKLRNILENAYAPYSNFKVSCIVNTKTDEEYKGVNVEVSSYGGTICAERNAINNAIANGVRKDDIKSIHIMNNKSDFAMPCMLCRQHFVDFFNDDVKVYVYNYNGNKKEYSMKELCPHPFNFNKENI